jgi:hypothetical protein
MNQESQKSFGGKRSKSGASNRKNYYLPRETFAGERSKGVSRGRSTAEKSSEKKRMRRELTKLEGLNLLSKASQRCVSVNGNRKGPRPSVDGINRRLSEVEERSRWRNN